MAFGTNIFPGNLLVCIIFWWRTKFRGGRGAYIVLNFLSCGVIHPPHTPSAILKGLTRAEFRPWTEVTWVNSVMLQTRQTYLGSEDIRRFSHKYKNFFDCHNSFTSRQLYRNLSVRSCLAATPLHTCYYFKSSFNNHLIDKPPAFRYHHEGHCFATGVAPARPRRCAKLPAIRERFLKFLIALINRVLLLAFLMAVLTLMGWLSEIPSTMTTQSARWDSRVRLEAITSNWMVLSKYVVLSTFYLYFSNLL